MIETDPIRRIEEMVRDIHDGAGKYTQPVLKRYPLLFAFLLTFSLAAILHGFELFADQIEIFQKHPTLLVSIGILTLLVTGALYKSLGRHK
jgi:hypothetical protein